MQSYVCFPTHCNFSLPWSRGQGPQVDKEQLAPSYPLVLCHVGATGVLCRLIAALAHRENKQSLPQISGCDVMKGSAISPGNGNGSRCGLSRWENIQHLPPTHRGCGVNPNQPSHVGCSWRADGAELTCRLSGNPGHEEQPQSCAGTASACSQPGCYHMSKAD